MPECICDHQLMPSRRIEWAVAGTLAGWAAARLASADRLRFSESLVVPLLSFTPQAAAGAWASAFLLRGKGPATVSALAGAAMTAAVAPRAIRSRQPAAAGPALRLLTANLLGGRATAEALVDLASRKQADVVFVQELTDGAADRLKRAGLTDLLPHTVRPVTAPGRLGTGIYSRYRISAELSPDLNTVPPGSRPLSAARSIVQLDLPSGQSVRLACIHTQPPKPPWLPAATARWRDQQSALPAPGDAPVILAGDFNATLDHAPFRRILDLGYADAASQTGRGLVMTWGPRPHRWPALLAIDHVLVDRRCAVLATSAHLLPGSDHRAVYAEIRLPAPE